VTKENRRLLGAVCVMLAAKMNDNVHFDFSGLLDQLCKKFDVDRAQVCHVEFQCFCDLLFKLHVALTEVCSLYLVDNLICDRFIRILLALKNCYKIVELPVTHGLKPLFQVLICNRKNLKKFLD